MAGIYIHIPFCKQACHYCDFHFSTSATYREEMVQALAREIELQKGYLENQTIRTLYLGGGTPSLLSYTQLQTLFETLYAHYKISTGAEITLEANPDDINEAALEGYRKLGINRISLGIQTFDPELLKWMNRAHTREEALQALSLCREKGFSNLNLDLIYGLPTRDHRNLENDLKLLLDFKPEHISTYSLTVEPNTALGRWAQKGKYQPQSEDFNAEEFELIHQLLTGAGYLHYEVSNYALTGKESLHNSNYWQHIPYLGIGPSAHSFNGNSRQFNLAHNQKYMQALRQDVIPFEQEELQREDLINEYIMTGLRTHWGIDLTYLKEQYNFDLFGQSEKFVRELIEHRKAVIQENRFILTLEGRLLADEISADLFQLSPSDSKRHE